MTKKMLAFGALCLVGVFAMPVSQAKDDLLFISYAGTVREAHFNLNDDDFSAGFIDAQAHGTFGASMVSIFYEFTPAVAPTGHSCTGTADLYLVLMYSKAVTTFKNGDQLYADTNSGEMCLNLATGDYEGVATGTFMGGTGRFANASGDFQTPFTGKNLALLTVGFGFGSFQGVMDGTVSLD